MLALSIVDNRRIYDWLFDIYVPIGIGVFAVFTLAIVGAAIRYRRRDGRADRRRHNEANALEIGYAVLLTCVAACLLYLTYEAEHQVDTASARERPALTIDVVASRWEWTFHYPAYGITHESGAVGDQPLVVPVNEAVRFRLVSRDVMHSFWIPEVRFKRDAIPGSVQVVTLDFDQVGRFSGSCAEYCGLLHAEMVFPVDVLGSAAFRAWAASGGAAPA